MSAATDLPPFVHRKKAKGKTYYYFAIDGEDRYKYVRLPDRTDPTFDQRVAELYQRRRAPETARRRIPGERKVYFIGCDTGPIKIGVSKNPEKRCRDMTIGAPDEYRVLATVIGGHELERAYHERFEFAHLRGEWFERRPEIEAEIERLNKQ
jgi:hypothetical protein